MRERYSRTTSLRAKVLARVITRTEERIDRAQQDGAPPQVVTLYEQTLQKNVSRLQRLTG